MDTIIVNQQRNFTLFGFSKYHEHGKPYSETIIELMDKVWKEVRDKGLSNAGINHILYGADQVLFAGIELLAPPVENIILEKREFVFRRYAYCKHIGPYAELGKTYERIKSHVEALGEHLASPFLEIYGHRDEDESKLETKILYNLG